MRGRACNEAAGGAPLLPRERARDCLTFPTPMTPLYTPGSGRIFTLQSGTPREGKKEGRDGPCEGALCFIFLWDWGEGGGLWCFLQF